MKMGNGEGVIPKVEIKILPIVVRRVFEEAVAAVVAAMMRRSRSVVYDENIHAMNHLIHSSIVFDLYAFGDVRSDVTPVEEVSLHLNVPVEDW